MPTNRFPVLAFMAALFAATIAGAQEQDPLAAPKPQSQVGFPTELYSWVIPPDNPQSPEKVALGRKLFFDDRLSADHTISCDNCHSPTKGFTDQLPTSMGIHHAFGQRNAPTVLNALFNTLQFWDGRAPSLEIQVEGPILNPVEMGNKSLDDVAARVKTIAEYQQPFQQVFGGDITIGNIEKAIAAYERTQITFDTPFDHFMKGDQNAISASAKRGWSLFNGQGRCMTCHGWNPTQPLFSDNRFHNIGGVGAQVRLRAAGAQSAGVDRTGWRRLAAARSAGDSDRHERSRPLPCDQATA